MKILRNFGVALLFAASCAPAPTSAQSIGGSISGIVRDAGGALPQAEVRITNAATGQSRVVLTDDQGRYALREVPPGRYELSVTAPGYKTFVTPLSDRIQLKLGQIASLATITLKVSAADETGVEGTGVRVAMVDSTTSTRGATFDQHQIQDLPLSARDVNNLAPLAAGVASVNSFNVANTFVAFAVNGSGGRDNNFIIDSVDNNDPIFGGAATQFTNAEIFEDFHILTGQYQAEYGRNSGGIVNVVTKQGGRDFHGSAFWYAQNDALNAMTKVEKQSDLTKPARFYENQIGATVSGPILKNSLWFFASYQWDHARNDLDSEYPVVATLPTPLGFNTLTSYNAAHPSTTLTDFLADPMVQRIPTLQAPCNLPGKTGFASAQNPCTVGAVPGPLFLGFPVVQFGTYVVPNANITVLRDHQAFGRIDQKLGERDNFFFRYLFDDFLTPLAPTSSPSQNGFLDSGILPEWRDYLGERTQNFGAAWNHAFRRALNELRFAYSRTSSTPGPLHPNSPTEGDVPQIIVEDQFAVSPTSNTTAAGSQFTLGTDSRPSQFNFQTFQIQENYSLTSGRNQFKLGGAFTLTNSTLYQMPGDLGQYDYRTLHTFMTNESDVDNGILPPLPFTAGVRLPNLGGIGGGTLPLHANSESAFFQDEIRISSRVVIDAGLRYESYNPFFNAVVDRSQGLDSSPPKLDRSFNGFAPRLGFAAGIGRRSVIRGGYGIFYNPSFLDVALLAWQSSPVSPFLTQIPAPNTFPQLPYNPSDASATLTFEGQGNFCYGGTVLPLGTPGPPLRDCSTQNTVSKTLRNPFEQDFSFGFQTELGENLVLESSYFGSRGDNLFQRIDANPSPGFSVDPAVLNPLNIGSCTFPDHPICMPQALPPPQRNRGTITELTNGGFSTFDALELSATKRLGRNSIFDRLLLTAAYTWSHAIDNTSDPFSSGLLQRFPPPATSSFGQSNYQEPEVADRTPFAQNPANTQSGEKGNSSFDRRQRLALSFVWSLPRFTSRFKEVTDGWQVSGVLVSQSGQPFSPENVSLPNSFFLACAPGKHGPVPLGAIRPDIGNPHAPLDTVALLNNIFCLDPNSREPGVAAVAAALPIVPGAGPYITPSGQPVDPTKVHFVQTPITEFGDAGRNILVGPGTLNLDLSVSKRFALTERVNVSLTFQAFDVLNRNNPGLLAGNPFLATDQNVSSTIFRPAAGFTLPAPFSVSSITGLTPETGIDAGATALNLSGPTFASQKYLTVSSRRVQLSLKFVF